ncbi:hypothetical protein HPB50_013597 [Hyalomma asiaticum]|uniref:Uncharacterized protein n=1 Tax=Hyalomma asiaticum TaxID=266040 RepID=A0ACB7RKP5_HYAAI|nr:hypothetical protein HPB50_013597 [Hyalomma asiaticum]
MQSSGIDVKELRREIDDLKQSMEILNGLVETLRSEKAVLAADNKKMLIENSLLSRKVEEIEQYSRINNVEIKGIPCTQGEDCVTILQKPRPQGDCDAHCALRRALLDSLSQGYARHNRGPLQQEMEVAAARRPGTRAYQLRVRAALMDSLCYPSGNQKR